MPARTRSAPADTTDIRGTKSPSLPLSLSGLARTRRRGGRWRGFAARSGRRSASRLRQAKLSGQAEQKYLHGLVAFVLVRFLDFHRLEISGAPQLRDVIGHRVDRTRGAVNRQGIGFAVHGNEPER